MTICKQHPGGAKELPATAFYPSDQGRSYAPCKECRKTNKRIEKPAPARAAESARGNPHLQAVAAKINAAEQVIAHSSAIGGHLNRLLTLTNDPAIAEIALHIAAAAGAIKHIAQEQRDKEDWKH